MLRIARETGILFNDEYLNYQDSIRNVQQRLQRDIELLGLETDNLIDALDYANDRVTIFRFLKDTDFSEDAAIERLLDTINWRTENKVSRMTYQSIASEFFEDGFAFFHKQDLIGRPVAIIQMRHFPNFRDKTKTLADFMQPFACLVFEMARQITRDLTRKNEKEQVKDKPVLVSQISIILDIAKAPFVPVDSNLMQALKKIVNSRYPGFVGSVYIMNFGWMYQGIWQVVKLVLSEQAKARVNFTTGEEMKQVMDENDLLKVLGGKDDYDWSLESDLMLDLYATENRYKNLSLSQVQLQSLQQPTTNITANRISRSSSFSSLSSIESGMFFDAPEFLSPGINSNSRQSFEYIKSTFTSASPSIYGTPGTLTPINSYNRQVIQLQQQQLVAGSNATNTLRSEPRYFLNGFHMGDSFLTSFFGLGGSNRQIQQQAHQQLQSIDGNDLTNRLNQLLLDEGISQEEFIADSVYLIKQDSAAHFPHMLPTNHPQSIYVHSPFKHQLARAEQKMKRLTRKLFHLSFAYKGAVYWVLLYCFLRGPVEHNLKKALLKLMASSSATQQQITYTTVGITATIAAALSASFSSSLASSNYNSNNNKRIQR